MVEVVFALLLIVDNKIVEPSGMLSGKNFESAFGAKT